jgi:hypothetical protein
MPIYQVFQQEQEVAAVSKMTPDNINDNINENYSQERKGT